jgi:hypothetical protein
VTGLPPWKNVLSFAGAYAYLGGKEAGSLELDPLFLNVSAYPVGDPSQFDFRVSALSPTLGGGVAIAAAATNGSASSVLTVNDAGGFSDGFGIVAGDMIRIGGGAAVRIIDVDYAANSLVLESPMTWNEGDPVHPIYTGSAPDIGAMVSPGDAPPPPVTSGTLRFSAAQRIVLDNSTVADSLVLRHEGRPLKALQLRLVTSGRTILRSISRGSVLPSDKWWFFSNVKRGSVQEDGSVSDTCSVVLMGTGTVTLPPGVYDNLVTFRYDVVNAAVEAAGVLQLLDVVGALADGSDAHTSAGGAQTLVIHNAIDAGDVNSDDRIDVLDVVLVVNHILQRSTLSGSMLQRADVAPWPAGDGMVDSRDLALIEHIILQKAYPDGVKIQSGPTPDIPGIVRAKQQSVMEKVPVRVRFILEGERLRIELQSSVDVAGVEWEIHGLPLASGSCDGVFGTSSWHSDSAGTRGLHYSPANGAVPPGVYQIGELTLAVSHVLQSSDVSLIVAGRNGVQIEDAAVLVEQCDAPAMVRSYSLEQNYPNPFNPSTHIRLSIAEKQMTIVKVFDLLGREVATLMDEVKEAGAYAVEFNATGLPSGVYFCRMQAGTFASTKKLLLVH